MLDIPQTADNIFMSSMQRVKKSTHLLPSFPNPQMKKCNHLYSKEILHFGPTAAAYTERQPTPQFPAADPQNEPPNVYH